MARGRKSRHGGGEIMVKTDVAVIGGGPAGLAAALECYNNGVHDIIIIERDKTLGGILQQCIHPGFGLHVFNEELTGPEYAQRYTDMVGKTDIKVMTDTMVISVSPDKTVTATNAENGIIKIKPRFIILAMGCRERTRGMLRIPGTRPSGIFTAGTAQRLINIEGYMPGHRVVILGSGDIGLIMARRMTLEGATVLGVYEIAAKSNGLKRNIVQCLDDFGIPLKLKHTVTEIHGEERLEGITVCAVDDNMDPIEGTEEYIPCDTLLLSVGLIPENELSLGAGITLDPKTKGPVDTGDFMTDIDGIYACGNVSHVYDLVDNVTKDSLEVGRTVARRVLEDR